MKKSTQVLCLELKKMGRVGEKNGSLTILNITILIITILKGRAS